MKSSKIILIGLILNDFEGMDNAYLIISVAIYTASSPL
jgi:hypothetical protein